MDSPLDAIDGSYSSAILTTFTIDLAFVDHWLLPRLSRCGVRNVVVFCDQSQLADQLSLGGSRKAGQHYHLAPIAAKGAFHPKLIYLSGPDGERLCVSSANLTAAGQLRNVESAVVLESSCDDHGRAILQAREFLRELSARQPSHVAEAILSGAQHEADLQPEDTGPIFLHNLQQPLIDQLPGEANRGTAPYATADAIHELDRRSSRFVALLDERRRDAIDQARGLGDELKVVKFVDSEGQQLNRVVHGKALWSDDGWCVVGSPNLTGPALLRTADAGNVEAAVVLDAPDFEPPECVPVDPPPLQRSLEPGASPSKEPGSALFSAFLDGDLQIEGLPDGCAVEQETSTYWEHLGIVVDGVVPLPGASPVGRLRSQLPDGRHAYAVVHHLPYLRARRRTPQSRLAQTVETLPLDVQGVRDLEEVLGNLYALDDLVEEHRANPPASSGGHDALTTASSEIETWKPARPGDEPRIPDLYRQVFPGDPDVLLALVRNALRLDSPENDETAVEDNEELSDDDADADLAERSSQPPLAAAQVVKRYRTSILAALARGAERIRTCKSDELRDLTYLEILRFHEQLLETEVRVPVDQAALLGIHATVVETEDVVVPLVEPESLVQPRWELLRSYLSAKPRLAGDCGSVTFTHLAAAVHDRGQLDETSKRRLDDMTYEVAEVLVKEVAPMPSLAWMSPQRCSSLLEPYAERTDWLSVVENCEAEGWLADADIELDPYPVVLGEAEFANWLDSPAWKVLGYSCIAGYADSDPFAAIVSNINSEAAFSVHCLMVEPAGQSIRGDVVRQALLRRSDGVWLCRTFKGFRRASADRLLETVGVRRLLGGTGSQETAHPIPPDWLEPLVEPITSLREGPG